MERIMDYIKFFNEKIKEKLEQDTMFYFASNSLKSAFNEIKFMRDNFPKIFTKNMSFEQLVSASSSFEQKYIKRQDEIDGYDYNIRQNIFNKEVEAGYQRAKDNAVEYYTQLGKFLERYSNLYLINLEIGINKNSKFRETCINNAIKKVITENISSAELTALINDVIKGVTPKLSPEEASHVGYGEYGLKVIETVGEEYKALQKNEERIKIQSKILDVMERGEENYER